MYLFAAEQQTNTAKLPVFSLNSKKRACELRVNETKLVIENASI